MDRATVDKVAKLGRLDLADDEANRMVGELGTIFKWIEQLGEVNTDGVEPVTSVVDIDANLRPDAVTKGNRPDDILQNAPESMEGYFVVGKVVE